MQYITFKTGGERGFCTHVLCSLALQLCVFYLSEIPFGLFGGNKYWRYQATNICAGIILLTNAICGMDPALTLVLIRIPLPIMMEVLTGSGFATQQSRMEGALIRSTMATYPLDGNFSKTDVYGLFLTERWRI
jgi:hypothetical protein